MIGNWRGPAFAVVPAKEGVGEVLIYDDIGPSWAGMIDGKSFSESLKGLGDVAEIVVRINSYGGDVFQGFAIYNALKNHPAKVTAEVDGIAASIASIILMAADVRRVAQNASVMIHNPWTWAAGDARAFLKVAAELDHTRGLLIDTYADRIGTIGRNTIGDLMDEETWFTAEEAVANGFADAVSPNKAMARRREPRADGREWITKPPAEALRALAEEFDRAVAAGERTGVAAIAAIMNADQKPAGHAADRGRSRDSERWYIDLLSRGLSPSVE
jgi:ATP-dependent protease ClpP protease subunit